MTHRNINIRSTVSDMAYDRLGEDGGEDIPLKHRQIINKGTEHQMILYGYMSSCIRKFFYHLFGILIGLPYLMAHWKPDWEVYWKKRKCAMEEADAVIVEDVNGRLFICMIESTIIEGAGLSEYCVSSHASNGNSNGSVHNAQDSTHLTQPRHRVIRYFIYQHMKYIWMPAKQEYKQIFGLDHDTTIEAIITQYRGYSLQEQTQRLHLYGRNAITVEVKSYFVLLISEVLNPFYIFQIASLILWSMDQYYLYAICIFLVSCLSIAVSLVETRRQSENLHEMVESSNSSNVIVRRPTADKETVDVEISALDLVPGDVLVIPRDCSHLILPCDAVLISGSAIVNESMLTGESVPVQKGALTSNYDGEIYNPEKHKRSTIFCGTTIIQTRHYANAQVLAIVVRTGFSTAKGELVCSILYPSPMDFKFYKDSLKFIGFLFAIASIGMGYSLYLYISRGESIVKTIVRTLDIVTIVVPPALPAAMTVGTYYAQSRLRNKGIFCISPPRINVSGKCKLFCFDKTGTLTEDGLDMWGVISCSDTSMSNLISDPSTLDEKSSLMAAMATCHSLTYINGTLVGDPLDIIMFEATKWVLEEASASLDCDRFDNLVPTVVRPPISSTLILTSSTSDSQTNSQSGTLPYTNSPHNSDSADTSSSDYICAARDDILHSDGGGGGIPGDGGLADNNSEDQLSELQVPTESLEEASTGSSNFDQVAPTIVKPSNRNTYIDPPDMKKVTETTFQVPYEVGIVRQFPFSSSIQRMAVMVRILGNQHMDVFVKGAPEVIISLCRPETVPEELSSNLTKYTMQGYRVIALAHRQMKSKLSWHKAQSISRDQVECDLSFLGILILCNMLKPESSPTIRKLQAADIRTLMITGDNRLTGMSVARSCGMVNNNEQVLVVEARGPQDEKPARIIFKCPPSNNTDNVENEEIVFSDAAIRIENNALSYHFALEGKDWEAINDYFPDLVPKILARGTIFARMSPDQKAHLVEALQKIDYIVGMCGDGANDCGALKAAHIGISLSEAEASVAAPFTSNIPNITCVPTVVAEGRCALTTNFSVFKYMALYSIIQFISVLMLYTFFTNLSDPQFLFIDLFIVTVVAVVMGYTEANDTLVSKRPLGNLLGCVNLFSVISQIVLVIAGQVAAYMFLQQQKWFIPTEEPDDSTSQQENTVTWETTVIFTVTSFQYLALVVVYSPGKPYRKPLYTNTWLLMSLIILTSICFVIWLYPAGWIVYLFQLENNPADNYTNFRLVILLMCGLHFIISLAMEDFVATSTTLKRFFQFLRCKAGYKNSFKNIITELSSDVSWPPIDVPITPNEI